MIDMRGLARKILSQQSYLIAMELWGESLYPDPSSDENDSFDACDIDAWWRPDKASTHSYQQLFSLDPLLLLPKPCSRRVFRRKLDRQFQVTLAPFSVSRRRCDCESASL